MYLMAEKYRTQRLRALSRNTKLRADAEQLHQAKHQRELNVLLHATEQGLEWTGLDGQLAFALAEAVRATLVAEEQAIVRRIEECRSVMATLRDSRDDTRGRILEAEFQATSVLNYFKHSGLPFQPSPLLLLDSEREDAEEIRSGSPLSDYSCSEGSVHSRHSDEFGTEGDDLDDI